MNATPGFRWCLGPGCDSGQIHDTDNGSIMTCAGCKFKQCTTCERELHEGESCEQYTARMAAQGALNRASEETIAQITKDCPNCKRKIEKNGGCDHMTCKSHRRSLRYTQLTPQGRKCRFQFCWLCGASYVDIDREGNTAHAKDCKYHSGNLIDPHNAHADAYRAYRQQMARIMAPERGDDLR